MNELLLTLPSPGGFVPGAKPHIGYNFNNNLSTGVTPIAVSDLATKLTNVDTGLGYQRVIAIPTTQSNVTPLTAADIANSDFTLELVFRITSSTSTYQVVFGVTSANSAAMVVQFGDSGFNNRLAVAIDATSNAKTYSCKETKATLLNKWTHLVFQRRAGAVSMYLNGVKQGLALGTSLSYSTADIPDTKSITGTTVFSLGRTQWPAQVQIAEFALHKVGRYSANFTPTYPLV